MWYECNKYYLYECDTVPDNICQLLDLFENGYAVVTMKSPNKVSNISRFIVEHNLKYIDNITCEGYIIINSQLQIELIKKLIETVFAENGCLKNMTFEIYATDKFDCEEDKIGEIELFNQVVCVTINNKYYSENTIERKLRGLKLSICNFYDSIENNIIELLNNYTDRVTENFQESSIYLRLKYYCDLLGYKLYCELTHLKKNVRHACLTIKICDEHNLQIEYDEYTFITTCELVSYEDNCAKIYNWDTDYEFIDDLKIYIFLMNMFWKSN